MPHTWQVTIRGDDVFYAESGIASQSDAELCFKLMELLRSLSGLTIEQFKSIEVRRLD
jgi:hypothetical protein